MRDTILTQLEKPARRKENVLVWHDFCSKVNVNN